MLSHPLLRLMTTVCSLYALSLPTVVLSPQALSAEKIAPSSGQSSAQQIKELATAFTVKVFAGQQRGSGVILAKSGQRYTVVTNAHVIDRGQPYRIQTSDGKTYTAVLKSKGDTFKGNDLAVLEFSAVANYQVAQWGDSGAIKGAERLFAVGFPEGGNQLLVSTGQVSLMAEKALLGGYRIGFSNETQQGMSGGALLNAQGKMIGILGQGNQAILERAYTYQDGSKPTARVLQQMRESSFAVPIATVRQMVTPAKIAQTPLPPPPRVPSVPPWNPKLPIVSIPKPTPSKPNQVKPTYTGVLGEVDKIAEQITVRIQGKNSQGSGVIVAKQDNIYTVLTAKHVVAASDTYRVTTVDGKEYEISPMAIKFLKEDLTEDLAVVQFSSNNSYGVATLGIAKLESLTRVFLSGFPENQFPRRALTTGRTDSEMEAKESYSLAQGVNLLYTNMSYPGMSGGPVLDLQGRVVAINTGAEVYKDTEQKMAEELDLGYSLGIPIQTFIGLSSQFALRPKLFIIESSQPPRIADYEAENKRILEQSDFPEAPYAGNAMDWLKYANAIYRLDEDSMAILACNDAIKEKPDLYYAYYLKGIILIRLGKSEEAVRNLDIATQISPSFYPAWRWKARALFRGAMLSSTLQSPDKAVAYQKAVLAYQKAIQMQGEDFILYNEQGDGMRFSERYEDAIMSYSKGIALHPTLYGYQARATVYQKLKQYDKALADLNKVIALQPDDAQSYYNRGVLYRDLKEYDKALADLNKVIALQPDDTESYYNRATFYRDLKEYDKALSDFNKIIALKPNDINGYSYRGNFYHNLKEYDKALSDFNKRIALKTNSQYGYQERGQLYYSVKQYNKALVDYGKAIALDPNNQVFYFERGNLYYGTEQYDKALFDYSKAITLMPNFALAYINRGRTYYTLKQYEKALMNFNKAITLNPRFVALAYINRGLTYNNLKQYKKAILDFQKAYLLAQQQGDTTVAQLAKRGIELLQGQQ
jgi:tetratricopeptide (TPR) repeat protein/S1-C subfamily serine protease